MKEKSLNPKVHSPNGKGYTTPQEKNERSIRDRENGLFGQDIWLELAKRGFVNNDDYRYKQTEFEKKLKNWLIWGRFEDRK